MANGSNYDTSGLMELISQISGQEVPSNDAGSFSRYKSIESYNPEEQLANLRAMNQRQEDQQARDSLARMRNSMLGAKYSGDQGGMMEAKMAMDQMGEDVTRNDSREQNSQQNILEQLKERMLNERYAQTRDFEQKKLTEESNQKTQDRDVLRQGNEIKAKGNQDELTLAILQMLQPQSMLSGDPKQKAEHSARMAEFIRTLQGLLPARNQGR